MLPIYCRYENICSFTGSLSSHYHFVGTSLLSPLIAVVNYLHAPQLKCAINACGTIDNQSDIIINE